LTIVCLSDLPSPEIFMPSTMSPEVDAQNPRRGLVPPGIELLAFMPLSALVALRGDTRDTSTYIDVFRQAQTFPSDPVSLYAESGMEWGFWLVSWLLNLLGGPPTLMFLVISLATFLFLHLAAEQVQLRLVEVAPYYLGTFFLLQQLMQIRQGVGAAFSLWVIVSASRRHQSLLRFVCCAVIGALMHLTTLLPLVAARLLRTVTPRPTRSGLGFWCLLIVIGGIAIARLFMKLEVIELLGRLSVYAVDDEYNAERGLLAAPNIRALLMLLCFMGLAPASLLRSRAYVLMLSLYAGHLGIRLGFFDFLILSGRLSTALGFVEVLMLPMLIHATVRAAWVRWAIALLYFATHLYLTLAFQAPFLVDDYFTPLHPTGS
jgi:EpsG family